MSTTATEITREHFESLKRHGYAGPLSTLHGAHTRFLFEAAGATHWALMDNALCPVAVV